MNAYIVDFILASQRANLVLYLRVWEMLIICEIVFMILFHSKEFSSCTSQAILHHLKINTSLIL